MTDSTKDNIVEMFEDGFSVDMEAMENFKTYEFEYDGSKMKVKKTDRFLQLFSD